MYNTSVRSKYGHWQMGLGNSLKAAGKLLLRDALMQHKMSCVSLDKQDVELHASYAAPSCMWKHFCHANPHADCSVKQIAQSCRLLSHADCPVMQKLSNVVHHTGVVQREALC